MGANRATFSNLSVLAYDNAGAECDVGGDLCARMDSSLRFKRTFRVQKRRYARKSKARRAHHGDGAVYLERFRERLVGEAESDLVTYEFRGVRRFLNKYDCVTEIRLVDTTRPRNHAVGAAL